MQSLGDVTPRFVQRSVPILIRQGDQSSLTDQIFGHRLVAPETRVVQRRIPVFIYEVYVGFVSQQL